MQPERDFEEWLEQLRPQWIRRGRSEGLKSCEAEDLVQEVCLACIEGADRKLDIQVLDAWVNGVFKNVLADHWMEHGRSPLYFADIEAVLRQAPPGSQGAREPGSQGARAWLRASADEIRKLLRPAWIPVFDLILQDVGPKAIAREIGIPVKRVKEIKDSITLCIRKAISRKKLPPL